LIGAERGRKTVGLALLEFIGERTSGMSELT